jgi:FKBP-type peptidyl-prolyl cis-trans isomerase (trigger factor)
MVKNRAPLLDAPRNPDPMIPQVGAPRVAGLQVDLPRAEMVDEALLPWLAEKYLVQKLSSHRRRFEEALHMGDWVQVNLLAFANGHPVPFTARNEAWVDASFEEAYPGCLGAIFSARVGDSIPLATTLSAEVEGQPQAGKDVVLVIEILAAFSPLEDSEKDGPKWQKALGAAADKLANQQRSLLAQAALQALRHANPVDVEGAAVMDYVHYLWAQLEAPLLSRMGIAQPEMAPLLEAWQASATVQAMAIEQLANTALLRAYGKDRGLELNKEAIAAYLKNTFRSEGRDLYDDADGALSAKREAQEAFHGLWYMEVLNALVQEVLGDDVVN